MNWIESFFFWYFASINIVYIILFFLACTRVYTRRKELSVEDFTSILKSNALPPITLIVPMYNEAEHIVETIKNNLRLSYRYKRLIVVNDGSEDNCLELVKKEFDCILIPQLFEEPLATQPIRGIYRSRSFPELVLIDKNHGAKFDTVNVGINACETDYFIVSDADTFLDDPGFEAMIRPILFDPKTVAVGASVRVKNGCTLDFNRISTLRFPLNMISAMQGLEYLRAFLLRQGWDLFGGNFVIAGAFSIFPKELIVKIGGFAPSAGEDMEIIVRLHRFMMETKQPFKIFYLPDPVAWTEGPSKLARLRKQRIRWHLALLETIWCHKRMCLNPRYHLFGLFTFPFWIWGEAIEPIVELLGFAYIFATFYLGTLDVSFCLLLLALAFGFIFIFTFACLFVEEMGFRKYPSIRSLLFLSWYSLIENIGYRQLTLLWRTQSFLRFFGAFKEKRNLARLIEKKIKTGKEGSRASSNRGTEECS